MTTVSPRTPVKASRTQTLTFILFIPMVCFLTLFVAMFVWAY